jgi:hypothetical protein
MPSHEADQQFTWHEHLYWLLPPSMEGRRQRRWRLMRAYLADAARPAKRPFSTPPQREPSAGC